MTDPTEVVSATARESGYPASCACARNAFYGRYLNQSEWTRPAPRPSAARKRLAGAWGQLAELT